MTMTTKATHTPGPWRLENMPTGWEVNSDPEDGGKWAAIAVVEVNHQGSRPVNTDEAEANANLIAAAPDLLAACEAVESAINSTASFDRYAAAALAPAYNQLQAAIAKAKSA